MNKWPTAPYRTGFGEGLGVCPPLGLGDDAAVAEAALKTLAGFGEGLGVCPPLGLGVDDAAADAALVNLRIGFGLYFGSGFVLRAVFFFLEAIIMSAWLSCSSRTREIALLQETVHLLLSRAEMRFNMLRRIRQLLRGGISEQGITSPLT
jgi:hypothetical protein